jgi:hypothetical protein
MTDPNPAAPLTTEEMAERIVGGFVGPSQPRSLRDDAVEIVRQELDKWLAVRATSTPAGLDVDLLARALRVVTRGSWSTPARRDPERQKRQDEAWLTRTAGAIAREYVALQGADPAYANDKGADPTPEPK